MRSQWGACVCLHKGCPLSSIAPLLQGLSVNGDILASLLGAPSALDLDPALAQPFTHWYYAALATALYGQVRVMT